MKYILFLLLFAATLPIFAQIGPAPVSSVNTWRVEENYSIGNAVIRNGFIYVSTSNSNIAFDPAGSPSQWSKVFSVGGTGIANTTLTVAGATQGADSCSSATTQTITGLVTSNVIIAGYSSSPAALTGWGASPGMVFQAWPSAADTLSWIVCNQTPSPITYSSITFNIGFK